MISEPVLDFWVVLKIVSVIQCVFFSSLILTTKSENPGARKFLVLFLLAFALLETDELFFYSRYIYQIPHWTGLADPLAYCLAPFIYFYVCGLTNRSFSFKKHHLYYFLPLPVLYLLWIPVYLKTTEGKVDFLSGVFHQGDIFQAAYPYNLFFATVLVALFSACIFLVMSFYRLYRFNVRIKQLYSSVDSIHLRWLKFLLILSSLIWLSSFLSLFMDSRVFYVMDLVAFPIFIFFISYYDLRQKRIPLTAESFTEEKDLHEVQKTPLPQELAAKGENVKYARSGISEETAEELSGRLMFLVNQEKVYLKNDLSLQELADLMETSTHKLSQLLNEKMNQSFYEFISYHRVQEVMRRLASDEFKHLKVLAIAFDSGFNSKTTFNAAFKKHAGLSPTEYRKNLKPA